ncbi:hypothetical protein C8R32_104101 [Nitrosospira sp. Nsp5]|uniref:Uncharacterized protein n=1 Tax=Nitrosospira multiformis TaxID=1231 RepID=A0ABY0TJ74_9PROT|nr:hypothetical protein C8R32_104101 [Nitrosospira sp. Nsp5]SDQ69195.1 hypothetical protein SAMN05216402_1880 [Nitrosospira multiformis]
MGYATLHPSYISLKLRMVHRHEYESGVSNIAFEGLLCYLDISSSVSNIRLAVCIILPAA